MKDYSYSEILNGSREAIIGEINKQTNNIIEYENALYGDIKTKKTCISSIMAIKELLYSIAEIAKNLIITICKLKQNLLQ